MVAVPFMTSQRADFALGKVKKAKELKGGNMLFLLSGASGLKKILTATNTCTNWTICHH